MIKRLLTAAALVGAFVACADSAQAQDKMTTYGLIRCENVNGDGYCPADTRNGVRLVREVGSERCTLGRNWGYERGGIWVSGGCGAEFEIGTPGADYGYGYTYNQGGVIVCASDNRRREMCRVDVRDGARLVRQLSRTQCVQGETWGFEREGIWVDDGCAGEFQLGGDGGYANPRPLPRPVDVPPPRPLPSAGPTLVCESDGRLRYCRTGILNYTATMVREFGDDPCILGRTWGQDQRGVWVDKGCAAEFRIRAGRDPGYLPPIVDVDVVRCESFDHRRNYCQVADRVLNVRLLRQNSRSPCIKGRTWGFGRRSGGIWVQNGCRADFRVVY